MVKYDTETLLTRMLLKGMIEYLSNAANSGCFDSESLPLISQPVSAVATTSTRKQWRMTMFSYPSRSLFQ